MTRASQTTTGGDPVALLPALIPAEVMVIAALLTTQQLATRIRMAYLRRRPWWRPEEPPSRVWVMAASNLLLAHRRDRRLPIDPELYVAAQPLTTTVADPWGDLTDESAIRHYRCRVFRIVRRLRQELRAEIAHAERRLARGATVESILRSRSRALTPLGRYIIAHRCRRPDLAEALREPAHAQHLCCPLYKAACHPLLPCDAYPDGDPAWPIDPAPPLSAFPYSLN